MLPEPARTSSGYRDYDGSDLERLKFVKLAQSLGLRLDEISEILALRDGGEVPCEYVRTLIGTKQLRSSSGPSSSRICVENSAGWLAVPNRNRPPHAMKRYAIF
ncbi:MAG: MerR family DNA-binding protein [Actinobacteria bacterium]|nr:MerR family DNA-binding protein [Actinomycetota bacterium]